MTHTFFLLYNMTAKTDTIAASRVNRSQWKTYLRELFPPFKIEMKNKRYFLFYFTAACLQRDFKQPNMDLNVNDYFPRHVYFEVRSKW